MRPVLPPERLLPASWPLTAFSTAAGTILPRPGRRSRGGKRATSQIGSASATGLRFCYIDWHMGGGARPGPHRRLVSAAGRGVSPALHTRSRRPLQRREYVPPALESWKSQRLPDGTLVSGPCRACRRRCARFSAVLEGLEPSFTGTRFTVCHPGVYSPGQAESVACFVPKKSRMSSAPAVST